MKGVCRLLLGLRRLLAGPLLLAPRLFERRAADHRLLLPPIPGAPRAAPTSAPVVTIVIDDDDIEAVDANTRGRLQELATLSAPQRAIFFKRSLQSLTQRKFVEFKRF